VLSYGEKVAKIDPVYPEIFDEIRQTTTWTRNAISIRLFSAETTRPIFTKILHDIVTLVMLFNHAYTRRYPIPFLNARVTKVRSLPFFAQNRLPWQRPLRYRKKRSRSIICTQNPSGLNKIPTAMPVCSGMTFSMATIFTSPGVTVTPEINMADEKQQWFQFGECCSHRDIEPTIGLDICDWYLRTVVIVWFLFFIIFLISITLNAV